MFFVACAIAAGLLVTQGTAVAVSTIGVWCCAHGTPRRQHKQREARLRRGGAAGITAGGIDAVFF